MASIVKIKRSSIQGKAPTTSDIQLGEIALNTRDGKLFSSDGSAVFEIGANLNSLSVGTGGLSVGNGAFTLPTTDGNADQVLTTDGAGNVTWEASAGQDRDGFTTALHYTTTKLNSDQDMGLITDNTDEQTDTDPFVTDANLPIYELMEPLGRTATVDCGSVA